MTDAPLPSPPRNLSGHPGHAKLREFWLQQREDTNGDRPDTVDNMRRNDAERANARKAAYEEIARAAWDDRAGMTMGELAAKYDTTPQRLLRYWRDMELGKAK